MFSMYYAFLLLSRFYSVYVINLLQHFFLALKFCICFFQLATNYQNSLSTSNQQFWERWSTETLLKKESISYEHFLYSKIWHKYTSHKEFIDNTSTYLAQASLFKYGWLLASKGLPTTYIPTSCCERKKY